MYPSFRVLLSFTLRRREGIVKWGGCGLLAGRVCLEIKTIRPRCASGNQPYPPRSGPPSPSGKASLKKIQPQLCCGEMQLIRRLRRHLPFQGKVKTGLRPFFPVWEGEVSGAWEMRGVPFVRSSSHPFPLYPLVSYSFPLSLYQGIT